MGFLKTLMKVHKVVKLAKHAAKFISMGAELADIGNAFRRGAREGWKDTEHTDAADTDLAASTTKVFRMLRHVARMLLEVFHGHDPFYEWTMTTASSPENQTTLEPVEEEEEEEEVPAPQMTLFQLIPGGAAYERPRDSAR